MGYTHEGPALYLTADGRVVEEGDVTAAFLLVATGGQLTDEEAAKYGLGKKAEAPPAPETKAKAPPANKSKG